MTSLEKCKKHHKPLLKCELNHYGFECDCLPVCKVCKRVSAKAHEKELKGCNIVMAITQEIPSMITAPFYRYFKHKPRCKLKKGDYAVLDYKTGFLVKAKDQFVQFFVIK